MVNSSSRLLVVDDLEDWRKTIGGVLQDKGYEVSDADTMDAAVSLLETREYDLVLVDLRLDDSDEQNVEGLILAKKIKDCWPQIRVVIVTGYETPETLKQALEPDVHGKTLVDDYLPKRDTDKLVETVQRILSRGTRFRGC